MNFVKIINLFFFIAIGYLFTMIFLYAVSNLEDPTLIEPVVFWASIFVWQFIVPYKLYDLAYGVSKK